jgi:hypothetical protein
MKFLSIIFLLLAGTMSFYAQTKKFQVNGDARGYLFAKSLDIDRDLDSIQSKKANYGHTLIDLGFSIFPNENTEIISSFRIRNELGGFWGGGVSFNVRQLTLRGVAGKLVKYELGDVDLKMTPYTLFNNFEEGAVNEAEIFSLRRDIVHYDMFYMNDNTWRMQGGKVQFGLKFNKFIQGIDFSGFITRQRPTDGITVPERLYGGGTMTWRQNEHLSFSLNSINLFDLTETINDSIRYSNNVNTFAINYLKPLNEKIKLGFVSEAGRSNVQYSNYANPLAPDGQQDWFYDAAIQAEFSKQKTQMKLGYKDVGADFFSPGAQSKRVDFSGFPGVFQQYTNAAIGRPVNLTDIINHNAQYSYKISEQLMAYNVAYNNITPYGVATPNRTGVYLNAERNDSVKIKRSFIQLAQLYESRGMGTNEKKAFTSIAAGADLAINDFFAWKRRIIFNVGVQHDITQRKGEVFEEINLSSTLIDLGLSFNIVDQLDLMVGMKYFQAKGNEFMIERNAFNTVQDFRPMDIDFSEFTSALGLRYRFSETNHLLVNYQNHNITHRGNAGTNYGISQFNILYRLTF